MSGLYYICEYGDEDDVQSEKNVNDNNCHKKEDCLKPRLPPPNLSGVSVVSYEEHVDDSNLHGGRVRTFPHVRGNWTTFVYIDYPDRESLFKITKKITALVSSVDDTCCQCEDFHISLSKTFVLKFHMINTFVTSLQECLSKIESFELDFESVDVYCNEDKTRTFVALKVDFFANRYLIDITKKIDQVLEEFRLPTFYQEPSFHLSILSINGNKKNEILNILHKLNEPFSHQEEKALETIVVNKVNCKSGNKYYQYYLK